MSDKLATLIESLLDMQIASIKATASVGSYNVKEAAEMGGDGEENFDGWLPLKLATSNKYYDFTLSELDTIRNAARIISDTNEIAKNCLLHYRNFTTGDGVQIDIVLDDFGEDPKDLANVKQDAQIRKMKENWKLFEKRNNLTLRLHDWVKQAHRDGEVFVRIFDTPDAPTIRFIDPTYIRTTSDDTAIYGIKFDPKDAETPITYYYNDTSNPNAKEAKIPAEDVIHDKRNVDSTAPRGISSYWAVMTNLRRLEKVLVNSSVLAAVQAAITMVRKYQNATGAKVQSLLTKNSDGVTRTDPSTGRNITSRKVRPGTVLDAPAGIEYDFPAHSVEAASFIKIAEHEMAHISANFVLPVKWLLTDEISEPLSPGSPTIANFTTEQYILFTHLEDLFWRVQGLMGINVEKNQIKYSLLFNGKRLAIAKALDEARVDEILMRVGATSPQEIASKHGNVWAISRANTIKYRQTRQPGEVLAGDSGNSNPNLGGGDGSSTTDGSQRANAGDGGNQKV